LVDAFQISERAKEMCSDVRPVFGDPDRSAAFYDGLDEKDKVKVLTMALKASVPPSFRLCGH
jgi:hypothetical protein